LIKLTELSSC